MKLFLGMLGLTLLFNSCGELDLVLSSSGTYRVNALVNNKALDECSLIAETDEIYPYFAASVANDPDVTGLMVYLQSPSGKTEGSRVQYVLKSAEPFSSGEQGDEETNPDTIITLSRLDSKMPRFNLPSGLAAGPYTLVFQVLGGKEVLHRSDQAVYYLGTAAFTLTDIQCYLPGISDGAEGSPDIRGSHLVPSGITVMLDVKIQSDLQLDPYVVWYNGKKRISEGRYSGGAGLILWKAPEQTGFYTIRAEIFPVKPDQQIAGISREIFLPVSSKVDNRGYFYRYAEKISQWYKFWGNLGDSMAPTATEKALIPRETKPIRWSPAEGLYGLSIGPEDIYLLPEFAFGFSGGGGSGSFLFHFKPLSSGIVFQASFRDSQSSVEGLRMSLLNRENSCSLVLESGGRSSEITTDIPFRQGEFVPVAVDFSVKDALFTAVLNTKDRSEPVEIILSGVLSGEGSLQFGAEAAAGTAPPEGAETVADSAGTAPPAEDKGIALTGAAPPAATAVIDEFAIINSSGFLLSGEPAQENSADDTVPQKNPGSS
jgi:hypothetical protein